MSVPFPPDPPNFGPPPRPGPVHTGPQSHPVHTLRLQRSCTLRHRFLLGPGPLVAVAAL